MNKTYPIMEIFTSVQGEGVHMGKVCTFVRFAGCNLSCPWCDTKESWDISKAMMLTVEEIVNQCHANRVVLTGGEPSLYELTDLIDALHARPKRHVSIETNGTRPMNPNWELNWVTCSPKPPEYRVECDCNELKYVVTDDFDPDVICWKGTHHGNIFMQPESHRKESMQHAYKLAMLYPNYLRLGVQLHKVFEVR